MQDKYFKISSPAKINLYLKIKGKTENNYHIIESIFHTINLNDIIFIKRTRSDKNNFKMFLGGKLKLGLSEKNQKFYYDSIKNNEDNLIIKAVNKLRRDFDIKNGYDIKLIKNIPIGAGLGGGSSNAAQIINFINADMNLNLNKKEKIAIAKELGADVPFFLFGGLALVRGIGEKIKNFRFGLNIKLLLIYPSIFTSTKLVYENLKRRLTIKSSGKYNNKIYFKNKKEIMEFLKKNKFKNELEESCFELYPEIKKIKNELNNIGFKNVFLSGSGSTLCAFINRKESDERVQHFIGMRNDLVCFETCTTKGLKFYFEEAYFNEYYRGKS